MWSPAFLRVLKRVRIQMFDTFDSHATPKPGQARVIPKRRADIDLEKLGAEIAATVERSKEQDPKALRAKVHALQTQLAEKDREIVSLQAHITELEHRQPQRYPDDIRVHLDTAARSLDAAMTAIGSETPTAVPPPARPARPAVRAPAAPQPAAPRPARRPQQERDELKFRAGAQRMLESLGRMAPLRLTKAQWGTVARMKHTSGTFSTYLGELRRADLITEDSVGFTLTDAGFDYLGGRPAPMTGAELQQHYLSILRSGASRMLQTIMDAYPAGLTKNEISERVGIVATSGTFSTYLGELRRNGLIEQRGAELAASDILMQGAVA